MLKLILTSTYKKSLKKYKHNKPVLQELARVVELLTDVTRSHA